MVKVNTMDEEKERKVAKRFLGLNLNEFFKECYQNNVNPVQALRAIKRQVRIDDGPFCCECGGSIHPEEVCLCAGCSAKDLSGEGEDGKRLYSGDVWTYDGKPEYVYLVKLPNGMYEIWPSGSRFELDRDCLGEFVGNFYPKDGFFEKLGDGCNGSLFITKEMVLFDPKCRTEDLPHERGEILIFDDGDGYQVRGAEATGITLTSEVLRGFRNE